MYVTLVVEIRVIEHKQDRITVLDEHHRGNTITNAIGALGEMRSITNPVIVRRLMLVKTINRGRRPSLYYSGYK